MKYKLIDQCQGNTNSCTVGMGIFFRQNIQDTGTKNKDFIFYELFLAS